MAIPYIRDFDPAYGDVQQISPRIQRLVADNPGPFTFAGTGVYIIGNGDAVCVIDPGPDTQAHRAALWKTLSGRKVMAVLLTHHHLDHTPLARPLADAHGCEVLGMSVARAPAFESEALLDEGVDESLRVDRELSDGDRISGPDFTLRTVHTPGHTSNHLCFALEDENALLTGDHIMGWSTTVVVPPDGSMRDYMQSLQAVADGDYTTLYPTHGAPITDVEPFLDAYRDHRLSRENKVRQALTHAPQSVTELVEIVYAETNPRLWPAASQSLTAHLIWLAEKGEAVTDGSGWRLT